MTQEAIDNKEFEKKWKRDFRGRSMNTEFGNVKEWCRNFWLEGRRKMREKNQQEEYKYLTKGTEWENEGTK